MLYVDALQHNLPDNRLTCCISVNFIKNETPSVRGRTADFNWYLLHDFARNAVYWLIPTHVRARYMLQTRPCRALLFPFVGFTQMSLICSESIFILTRHTRIAHPIHQGFFVLRTYVLWKNNKIVVVCMLSIAFVSLMPSTHPFSLLMNQSDYGRSISRHPFGRYCHLILFVLSPSPTTVSHIFTPLSQLWSARYQASQAAPGARVVSYTSCYLFSCLRFNWVCCRELGG